MGVDDVHPSVPWSQDCSAAEVAGVSSVLHYVSIHIGDEIAHARIRKLHVVWQPDFPILALPKNPGGRSPSLQPVQSECMSETDCPATPAEERREELGDTHQTPVAVPVC